MTELALDYDVYAFDIDGTVTIEGRATGGARETLGLLRRLGREVAFITNDATQADTEHSSKLRAVGIEAGTSEVITPLRAMDHLLREVAPRQVLAIAPPSVLDALSGAGHRVTEEDEPGVDVVVVGHDYDFTYGALRQGMLALRRGARFLATNPDAFRPTLDGGEPGTGALVAALESCSGRRAEVLGKPSRYMQDVLRDLRGSRSMLMVGDQLDTDIRIGRDVGIDTALVLTGTTATPPEPDEDVQPTYVLNDLGEIVVRRDSSPPAG